MDSAENAANIENDRTHPPSLDSLLKFKGPVRIADSATARQSSLSSFFFF